MKELIKKIQLKLFYKLDHYGMCPECKEKNKQKLVFCTHGTYEYYYIKSLTTPKGDKLKK